jgi:TPR repeat protein
MTKSHASADAFGFASKADVPVFDTVCGDASGSNPYPDVWITVPERDKNGVYAGRRRVGRYPDPHNPDGDPYGTSALGLGGRYYDEGMECIDAADHERRIDCFRAAELLYLHAAMKHNAYAFLCLGYVYSYNRCEGRFYEANEPAGIDPLGVGEPFSRERRAFECLEVAADSGLAEGCYKLGDLYKRGMGCEPSDKKAFDCYLRASELAEADGPVVWGSIGFRLGDAYEHGRGCRQDFARAHAWYRKAVIGLRAAVTSGDWYYEGVLARAEQGVKRCEQELSLADE